ncbi:hypothetical protein QJS66_06125 [Kocuria rhizophila]|nr:hypothetical protein QJS66_06125 [Kocuria rhizophila]
MITRIVGGTRVSAGGWRGREHRGGRRGGWRGQPHPATVGAGGRDGYQAGFERTTTGARRGPGRARCRPRRPLCRGRPERRDDRAPGGRDDRRRDDRGDYRRGEA